MKKYNSLFIISLTMIVLSACNTDEGTIDKANPSSEVSEQVNGSAGNNSTTVPKVNEKGEQASVDSDPTESKDTLNSESLSYTIAKVKYQDAVTPTPSEQLDYTVNLTDKFYLTQEEPGIDSIVYKDNEAITMRVEVFNKDEWSFEDARESSKEILSANSVNDNYSTFALPQIYNHNTYKQFESYQIEYESDKFILVLLDRNDKIIRLTIFDDYITNVSDAFLQIGATIQ